MDSGEDLVSADSHEPKLLLHPLWPGHGQKCWITILCASVCSREGLEYASPKIKIWEWMQWILNVIEYDMSFMNAFYESSWTVNIAELFIIALF